MLWRFFANQDKKKKLKNIIGQKRVQIEGMTCEHCKNRVENALNRLEGVSAKVNLKKKTADLSLAFPKGEHAQWLSLIHI